MNHIFCSTFFTVYTSFYAHSFHSNQNRNNISIQMKKKTIPLNLIKIISWISSLIYCVLKRNSTPYDPHHFQKQQTKSIHTRYKQTYTHITQCHTGDRGRKLTSVRLFIFLWPFKFKRTPTRHDDSLINLNPLLCCFSLLRYYSACCYAKYNTNLRNSILHFICSVLIRIHYIV